MSGRPRRHLPLARRLGAVAAAVLAAAVAACGNDWREPAGEQAAAPTTLELDAFAVEPPAGWKRGPAGGEGQGSLALFRLEGDRGARATIALDRVRHAAGIDRPVDILARQLSADQRPAGEVEFVEVGGEPGFATDYRTRGVPEVGYLVYVPDPGSERRAYTIDLRLSGVDEGPAAKRDRAKAVVAQLMRSWKWDRGG